MMSPKAGYYCYSATLHIGLEFRLFAIFTGNDWEMLKQMLLPSFTAIGCCLAFFTSFASCISKLSHALTAFCASQVDAYSYIAVRWERGTERVSTSLVFKPPPAPFYFKFISLNNS